MASFTPLINATAGYIPQIDGLQETSPIWYHGWASTFNAGPDALTNTRYIEPIGEVWGAATPALQDTYLTGTGSRTGTAFTATTGTFKDDYRAPWSDRYGIQQPDGTLAAWALTETTPGDALSHRLVIIEMGLAPASNAAAHDPAETYAYLELAHGALSNYRLVFEWSQPIRLEFTFEDDDDWKPIAIARDLGSVEDYLAHHDSRIKIGIHPDPLSGRIIIEIGDGHWLKGPVPRPSTPDFLDEVGSLPSLECYQWSGAYRWSNIEVYPLTFANPSLETRPRHFGSGKLANLGSAQVLSNFAARSDPAQTLTMTPSADSNGNLSYTAEFGLEDNSTPPRFSDVIISIPSNWTYNGSGITLPQSQLSRRKVRLLEVWDDATRMGMSAGRLLSDNSNQTYSGAFGNYALNLGMGNGLGYGQMMRGIIGGDPEGIKLSRHDPHRFVEFPLRDFWAKLGTVSLNQEVTLDGLCIYTAVRLLLDIGQVNPEVFGLTIPSTGFPPIGGYPAGFPHYILGKGSGTNPKYRYPPNMTVLAVLQDLIQDSGDPFTGYPHYMWFDVDGQFHWEPYYPQNQFVAQYYSDTDATGYGAIYDIHTYNSVADLRTGITVQGQDALAYDLLQYSLPLPGNIGAVGYQIWSTERKASYASPAYIRRIAEIMAIQASKPSQIVRMLVPFWPHVHAGMTVGIQESVALGRAGLFTVMEIDSTVGYDVPYRGERSNHCESWITARAIESSIL